MIRSWIKLVTIHILFMSVESCSSKSVFRKSGESVPSFERVVNNSEVAHSALGVPVDFSYNETNSLDDTRIPSVAGCPKAVKGFPWVYYGNPARCYLAGTRGPCPAGQLLFADLETSFGVCDCSCSQSSPVIKIKVGNDNVTIGISGDDKPTVVENERFRFCRFSEMLEINEAVFIKETGACYYLETQGFCREGEWLVKDKTARELICVPQCSVLSGPLSTHTFDFRTRECIQKIDSTSQPVSLSGAITRGSCDDGAIFSKLLQKCVHRWNAFFVKRRNS